MRHTFKNVIAMVCLACLGSMVPSSAQEFLPTKTVLIYKDQNHLSFKHSIQGYNFVDYVFEAKAGQSVDIRLSSTNLSNYFNLQHAEETTALFIGSTSGNHYKAILPKHGQYTIRVYLMRNAARRGERADYTLDFNLSETIAPQTINPQQGPRYFDAQGHVPCSLHVKRFDTMCHFRVLRNVSLKTAQVWIEKITPNALPFRVLNFDNTRVSLGDNTPMSWEKKEDNWYVTIDNQEFYIIPDALIDGG